MWKCWAAEKTSNSVASVAGAEQKCQGRDDGCAEPKERVAGARRRALRVNEDQDAAHEPQDAKWRDQQHTNLTGSIRDEREQGEQSDGGGAEHHDGNTEQSITKPAHDMKV